VRRLSTGEEFYTNFPKSGAYLGGSELVTLEAYLASLRENFLSVKTSEFAIDNTGRRVEGDVAIFLKRATR